MRWVVIGRRETRYPFEVPVDQAKTMHIHQSVHGTDQLDKSVRDPRRSVDDIQALCRLHFDSS